ncbi:kelch repeat and BTB domain-containing protein 11-like [Sinocyclocheilus grahami]|uniref:Kelch repeat and BTB domain containing 11 n=1 Tax=Sinocyclocheilus grahami TaxID=75366 RepID=A0A672NY49_SINGR|nr:PREDICTED: kelch repeat and BTB domain-containing protein 11-like [Sinocyclocheilus grahami]XP_016124570.1 PREDICTED: kelch repeat and BTB domain-containing protein 11-like [Sinocyclocheilus grahami]XP_016124579.1 PREDICTED: kelch repeat and BTB domain-containing protein 11-like [Sinocyclocheilus grahami]
MNNTLQDRNMFTVQADVIFHAANPDSPESPIPAEGNNNNVAAMGKTGIPSMEILQGLPGTWDTSESGGLTDNRILGNYGAVTGAEYAQDAVSSDSGFQEHIQPLDSSRAQNLDLSLRNISEASSQGNIREETNGTKVASSLAPSLCFRPENKEEIDKLSNVLRDGEVVQSQFDIKNVSSTSEDKNNSYSSSQKSRSLEKTLGCFISSSEGADQTRYRTSFGQTGQESSQGLKQNGSAVREALSAKEEPNLVIEVGGQKIQAHKSVLAEKSDYFKARLSRDILKVKGMSYKTLSVLVDYVYSSQMNVSKDNIVDVITGAKILQMPCAVQAAIDTIATQITPENCYEILMIAKKQRLNELKETAYRFMSDNFLQVLRDPAVYGRLTGSERDLILRKRMESRQCLMVAEINDVFERVGSRPPSRNSSRPQSPLSITSFEDNHMIYYYNKSSKDWHTLTVMPEDINTRGCGICTMYNYLFVAGGIRGTGEKSKVSDKVFCYNPITDRWSEVRPMSQARSQLKLVSMDGNLYAIGGECLFTVEKYDPRMDRWMAVAPLPKGAFAVAHEATTCNGELYVSGGSLFYRLLKYDPKRDEWQECPYNNSRKKSTDMVALKSFIYRFDVNREQGISVFKYNTIVKMWHDCASQQQGCTLPFRCAVIDNCIYCVNKSQTLQFIVEEDGGRFKDEYLKAPVEAKGILFPFVLSLPERGGRIA